MNLPGKSYNPFEAFLCKNKPTINGTSGSFSSLCKNNLRNGGDTSTFNSPLNQQTTELVITNYKPMVMALPIPQKGVHHRWTSDEDQGDQEEKQQQADEKSLLSNPQNQGEVKDHFNRNNQQLQERIFSTSTHTKGCNSFGNTISHSDGGRGVGCGVTHRKVNATLDSNMDNMDIVDMFVSSSKNISCFYGSGQLQQSFGARISPVPSLGVSIRKQGSQTHSPCNNVPCQTITTMFQNICHVNYAGDACDVADVTGVTAYDRDKLMVENGPLKDSAQSKEQENVEEEKETDEDSLDILFSDSTHAPIKQKMRVERNSYENAKDGFMDNNSIEKKNNNNNNKHFHSIKSCNGTTSRESFLSRKERFEEGGKLLSNGKVVESDQFSSCENKLWIDTSSTDRLVNEDSQGDSLLLSQHLHKEEEGSSSSELMRKDAKVFHSPLEIIRVSLRSLPWMESRSAVRKEKIIHLFQSHFAYTICSDSNSLHDVFLPFVDVKCLYKHAARAETNIEAQHLTGNKGNLSTLRYYGNVNKSSMDHKNERFVRLLEEPPQLTPFFFAEIHSHLSGIQQRKSVYGNQSELNQSSGFETSNYRSHHYQLRDYQIVGVQFLLNSFHCGKSVMLSDDMGLGKTAQICSFLQILYLCHGIQGPHLIVVPLTSLSSWMRELTRWAPSLMVLKYHGSKGSRAMSELTESHRHSVVLTTPATFYADRAVLKKRTWVTITVDEAHCLKNDNTNVVALCSKMISVMRIAVTGTPIQNSVKELWTQMTFLYPYLCKRCPRSSIDDDLAIQQGSQLLKFIMLRRTKESMELGLPPRYDEPTLMIEPTDMQRALLDFVSEAAASASGSGGVEVDENGGVCEEILDKADQRGKKGDVVRLCKITKTNKNDGSNGDDYNFDLPARSGISGTLTEMKRHVDRKIMSYFMHLRKICNHPLQIKLLNDSRRSKIHADLETNVTTGLARLSAAGISLTDEELVLPSAKMMKLNLMLKELKEAGHRVLIFSNFTSQLDLLEGFVVMRGYHYDRLDGESHRIDRELSIAKFNDPNSQIFVFLVTTTAGGVGVTLTGADTVILYDCHYNPQIDRQAADRAHRIGQTKPVHVYRMCLKGAAEERIQKAALVKAEIGDLVIDGKVHANSLKQKEAKFFSLNEMREILLEKWGKTEGALKEGDNGGKLKTGAQGIQNEDGHLIHLSDGIKNTNNINDSKKVYDRILNELYGILLDGDPTSWDSRNGNPVSDSDYILLSPLTTVPSANRSIRINGVSAAENFTRRNLCFHCGEIMRPLEPLAFCFSCPKGYHNPDCLSAYDSSAYASKERFWTCPRHSCHRCGKSNQSDGGLFICYSCPRSYCCDCLDPYFLQLKAPEGLEFEHLSRRYEGMEEEKVQVKKGTFYLKCLHCLGLATEECSEEEKDGEREEEKKKKKKSQEIIIDERKTYTVEGDEGEDGTGNALWVGRILTTTVSMDTNLLMDDDE